MTYKPATFFFDTNAEDKTTLNVLVDATSVFLNKLSPGSIATLTPTPGAEVIHLTEDKRHIGASGYHILMNGIPTAYCSPSAAGRPYGYFNSGIIRATVVNGKVIHPAHQVHPALTTPGLITVVCHEIAEMLADGNIATYSAPDSKGNAWLLEPCDWVFGEYYEDTVDGNLCVFPNVALPAFTDVNNNVGPFDLIGLVKGPFQRSQHGYAYMLDKTTGKNVPVTY